MQQITSTEPPQFEILFATADETRPDFFVFTEECLRDLAAKDNRCRYDEEKRQLWVTVDVITNREQLRQ